MIGVLHRLSGGHQVPAVEIVQQMGLISIAVFSYSVQQVQPGMSGQILPQKLVAHQRCKALGGYAHVSLEQPFQPALGDDGTVAQIWDDVRMGRCVAVKHSGEAYTIYKNLTAEHPSGIVVGATVKAGDVIGTVGESAMVEIAEEPRAFKRSAIAKISTVFEF